MWTTCSSYRRSGATPVELRFEPEQADAPEDVTAEAASWLEPMKELAARLGWSLTGAKSRVQRARRKLKDALTDCCDVEMDRRGHAIGCCGSPGVSAFVRATKPYFPMQ